jgi:hypothetical protein
MTSPVDVRGVTRWRGGATEPGQRPSAQPEPRPLHGRARGRGAQSAASSTSRSTPKLVRISSGAYPGWAMSSVTPSPTCASAARRSCRLQAGRRAASPRNASGVETPAARSAVRIGASIDRTGRPRSTATTAKAARTSGRAWACRWESRWVGGAPRSASNAWSWARREVSAASRLAARSITACSPRSSERGAAPSAARAKGVSTMAEAEVTIPRACASRMPRSMAGS